MSKVADMRVDGPPIEPKKTLSDDQLRDGGLVPAQTWTRTTPSPNAQRVNKSKIKKLACGIKQVNVEAPVEAHAAIRALAKANPEQLQEISSVLGIGGIRPERPEQERRWMRVGRLLLNISGWRLRLVMFALRGWIPEGWTFKDY